MHELLKKNKAAVTLKTAREAGVLATSLIHVVKEGAELKEERYAAIQKYGEFCQGMKRFYYGRDRL